MSSCGPSNVYDNSPFVLIPDLPSNVYPKETKLPKIKATATLEEKTKVNKELLTQYRLNERHNIRAINSALKSHKNLQETYEKKGVVGEATPLYTVPTTPY